MTCTPATTYLTAIPNVRSREWYDRSIRSWTVIAIDAKDNQLGDAQYCARKSGLHWARRVVVDQPAVKAYSGSETEAAHIMEAFRFGR